MYEIIATRECFREPCTPGVEGNPAKLAARRCQRIHIALFADAPIGVWACYSVCVPDGVGGVVVMFLIVVVENSAQWILRAQPR